MSLYNKEPIEVFELKKLGKSREDLVKDLQEMCYVSPYAEKCIKLLGMQIESEHVRVGIFEAQAVNVSNISERLFCEKLGAACIREAGHEPCLPNDALFLRLLYKEQLPGEIVWVAHPAIIMVELHFIFSLECGEDGGLHLKVLATDPKTTVNSTDLVAVRLRESPVP